MLAADHLEIKRDVMNFWKFMGFVGGIFSVLMKASYVLYWIFFEPIDTLIIIKIFLDAA